MSTDPVTLELIAERLDAVLAKADAPAPRFLTVQGSADYCSLSPETVRRMISAGKLRALRPCRGRILIDRTELESAILSADGQLRKGRGRR